MEQVMPEKLFVCTVQINPSLMEGLRKFYAEGTAMPEELKAIRRNHLQYMYDISEKGILWLGGPSADQSAAFNVFAVDSLEEAKEAQQNDPYYAHGLFYDDKYFEWIIHMPLSKASPVDRERLEESCRELGII